MTDKKNLFKPGDFVFAKVKGYTPWPAKIKSIKNKRYNVFFYGTDQTGTVGVNDIHKYIEFKKTFATPKNLKRRKFAKAIEEIEVAINVKNTTELKSADDMDEIGQLLGNMKILEEFIRIELKFIDLVQSIQTSLTTEQANITVTLNSLAELMDLQFTDYMLLRNPESVDVIRRVRGYIGNNIEWKMPNEEFAEFSKKTDTIRDRAKKLYEVFKSLFPYKNDDKIFWTEFKREVNKLNSLTEYMSDEEKLHLSPIAYQRLLYAESQTEDQNIAPFEEEDPANEDADALDSTEETDSVDSEA